MRRFVAFVMVLLIAALPLRGMASVAPDPCAAGHASGEPAAAHHGDCFGCDHAANDVDVPKHHDGGAGADGCAHCAACAAGCGALYAPTSLETGSPPGSERIPFRPRHADGHFPTLPDRPPLAL